MTTRPGSAATSPKRSTPLELGLLATGLGALAFGAGALGWTLGHTTSSTTAAAPAAAATTTAAPVVAGDQAAGRAVFVDAGCGSCHALAATGAKGTVGPNLDQVKLTAAQALVWVKDGKGAMPSFNGRLTDKQLTDVSAFLAR